MSRKGAPSHGFEPVSPKAWKQQIQFELSGADYNTSVITHRQEGIKVKPFYTSEDLPTNPPTHKSAQTATPQGNINDFLISFEVYANHSDMANKKALWCIEKGCDKIIFLVQESIEHPEKLLANIPVDMHLNLILQKPTSQQIENFSSYLNRVGNPRWQCSTDPISHFLTQGKWWKSEIEDGKLLEELIEKLPGSILTIDSRICHSAGAHMSLQLAHAMSHFTSYAIQLSEKNTLSKIKEVHFQLHTGNDFLMEISKIKALDLLWASVCQSLHISLPYVLCVEGAAIDKTLYANNTNTIRNSTQLLSGVIAGAQEILCTPYDRIHKKSHAYSDRLAINQALILKHECHFKNIKDPLSGSYAVERLSYELAEKALEIYQKTEAKGGLVAGMLRHEIQRDIQSQYHKTLEKFQKGDAVLIGANYLAKHEPLSLEKYPFIKKQHNKTLVPPLVPKRYAMEWEQKIQRDSHENR